MKLFTSGLVYCIGVMCIFFVIASLLLMPSIYSSLGIQLLASTQIAYEYPIILASLVCILSTTSFIYSIKGDEKSQVTCCILVNILILGVSMFMGATIAPLMTLSGSLSESERYASILQWMPLLSITPMSPFHYLSILFLKNHREKLKTLS